MITTLFKALPIGMGLVLTTLSFSVAAAESPGDSLINRMEVMDTIKQRQICWQPPSCGEKINVAPHQTCQPKANSNHQTNTTVCQPPSCSDGTQPTQEFTRTISRQFPTSAAGTTAIYNRHGNVCIKAWNENTVKIDILITVNTPDQKEADKVFNQINVNFANTNGYVKAETVVGNVNSGGFWSPGNICYDYNINYAVYIPEGNQLDLQNKYGDAFVGAMKGNLIADIKYGELHTAAGNSNISVRLEQANCWFEQVNNLNGSVNSSNITVEHVSNVRLESQNSTCTFRRAFNVDISSKYDKLLSFGQVNNLKLSCKYSTIQVIGAASAIISAHFSSTTLQHISSQLDADLVGGNLILDGVQPGFDVITVASKDSDVELNLGNSSYHYYIASEEARIAIPGIDSAYPKKMTNTSDSHKVKEGYVGNSNSKSKVKAWVKGGAMVLK